MRAIFLSFVLFVSLAFGETLQILTEEGPPYNYLKDGKVEGMAVEVVREVLKRVNHPDNIKILPWSRAYQATMEGQNYALFPTSRGPEREEKFKWAGPISEYNSVFFAKKGSGIKIESLEDAKKVCSIGTYKDDYQEIFLKAQGFTNLASVDREIVNPAKLVLGQIDLWASGDATGYYNTKWANVPASELEIVFKYRKGQNYIVFSKNVSDELVKSWQDAIDAIKKDGTYQKISDKYLK